MQKPDENENQQSACGSHDAHIPASQQAPKQRVYEEEHRNKQYVAVTRAKQSLQFVVWLDSPASRKRSGHSQTSPGEPQPKRGRRK